MNSRGPAWDRRPDYVEIKNTWLWLCPIMACYGSSGEDFPGKVMPSADPCTCNKKCRSRSSSVVFLGLFLLSLSLHAVTLVCYLDLRSEVKREIIHQKRDSPLTAVGTDLVDPAEVFAPGHPRMDTGVERPEEVTINRKKRVKWSEAVEALFSFLTRRLFVCLFTSVESSCYPSYCAVSGCVVCALLWHVSGQLHHVGKFWRLQTCFEWSLLFVWSLLD